MTRMIKQHEIERIKLESRVQFSLAPLKDLVRHTRVQGPEFSKYAADGEERCIPVDVLIDVIRLTGNPNLLEVVADIAGYDLVPRFDETETGTATPSDMLTVISEFGDLARSVLAADADGKRDLLDKKNVRREGQQAVSAILKFIRSF
jgi:hypothetical protein